MSTSVPGHAGNRARPAAPASTFPTTKGRYVVINAYSNRNAGDAAIVLATDQVLNDLGHGRLVNATRYWKEDQAFYGARGLDVVPPVVPFPVREAGSGVRRAAEFVVGLVLAYSLVLAVGRRRDRLAMVARAVRLYGLAAIAEADGVVLCGGGYFYSGRRRVNLTLLHNAVSTHIATLVNRRVVMIPQSIGPLRTPAGRRLVGWALRRLPSIVIRERLSLNELNAIDADSASRALICPDVALYGWDPGIDASKTRRNDGASERRAILVAMDWTWARESSGPSELNEYVDRLGAVAAGLCLAGVDVTVTGHSALPEQNQDDMKIAERVGVAARRAGAGDVTVSALGGTPESLHSAFAQADVVVGTRLHACLIALAAGSPAIGLAYQPKTTGTYELLGLGDFVRDVAAFDAEDVTKLALACIGDTNHRDTIAALVDGARRDIRATVAALTGGR